MAWTIADLGRHIQLNPPVNEPATCISRGRFPLAASSAASSATGKPISTGKAELSDSEIGFSYTGRIRGGRGNRRSLREFQRRLNLHMQKQRKTIAVLFSAATVHGAVDS